ncbi:MAG TPA: DNA-3-methyladenine glycosylase, partial [Acidimicrobiales bacterium]|nr:DNA-3-methyladenine glycosylase [Acidimicrobiales bacterium]
MSTPRGAGARGRAGPAASPRPGPRRVVPRRFYGDDPLEVAPRLLNKLLVRGERAGRIVEVEAYRGAEDPASHAYRGLRPRNAVMFGPPGHLYVYFTYGMHFCANVVCQPEGVAGAVLLRALAPVDGIEAMRAARRPPGSGPRARAGAGAARGAGERRWSDRDLASGPARLCEALGITRADDGADLVTGVGGVELVDDGVAPPARPGVSGRVGLRLATDRPWRWW